MCCFPDQSPDDRKSPRNNSATDAAWYRDLEKHRTHRSFLGNINVVAGCDPIAFFANILAISGFRSMRCTNVFPGKGEGVRREGACLHSQWSLIFLDQRSFFTSAVLLWCSYCDCHFVLRYASSVQGKWSPRIFLQYWAYHAIPPQGVCYFRCLY